jgi:hypothetical protein
VFDKVEKISKGSLGSIPSPLKPNYFQKQCSSSSFLLTKGYDTGPKWQWSSQKSSSMS